MEIALAGALISVFGFGAANVVIKKFLANTSTAQALTTSIGAGVLALLVLNLIVGFPAEITNDIAIKFIFLAVGEVALYLSLYKAFDSADVTVASGIISIYPILSTLYAVIVLSEAIAPVKFIFVLLMVIGAIILGIDWQKVKQNGFQRKDLEKGIGWSLLCLALHAIYFPALGSFTGEGNWEFKLLAVKTVAFVLLVVIFFLLQRNKIQPTKDRIGFAILLGVLEVLGWIGIGWAAEGTSGMVGIIVALVSSAPLVTAILARIWLKEKLHPLQYVGIVIIVVGISLLSLP